jgi:hypothetical protein
MLLGESLYTFLINCYIIQESNIRKIYFGTFIMFEDISQENYSKYMPNKLQKTTKQMKKERQ